MQQPQVTCWPSTPPGPGQRQRPHSRLEDSPEMALGPGRCPSLPVSPRHGAMGAGSRAVTHLQPKLWEKGEERKNTMLWMEESSQKAEHFQSTDALGAMAQSSIPGRPGVALRHRSTTAQGNLLADHVGRGFEEEHHCLTHQKHAGNLALVMQGPSPAGRGLEILGGGWQSELPRSMEWGGVQGWVLPSLQGCRELG